MSQIFNSHLQLTFALNVILSNMLSSSRTCRRHNLLVLALVSRPSGLHLKRCGFKYIGKLRQQLCAVRTDTHCYSYTRRLYCKKHAVTDTFLLTSIPLKIYWIPMMSHFSDLSDITLNMYYINSSHLLNSLVIISVPVDTASPSLLYLQSSYAKTSLS